MQQPSYNITPNNHSPFAKTLARKSGQECVCSCHNNTCILQYNPASSSSIETGQPATVDRVFRPEDVLEALMGCKGISWLVLSVTFAATALFWEIRAAGNDNSRNSLTAFLYDYALHGVRRLRTGVLYAVDPPANMSGVELSIVRLRTHRLWQNGANFSSVEIPAKAALPWPFTKRISIVYQNLGNWSTSYYSVPGHTLVAPVIAFLVYDSYTTSGAPNHRVIELNTTEERKRKIHVRFPGVRVQEDPRIIKCVRFDTNGTTELSDAAAESACLASRSGHFSLVIPEESSKNGGFKGWMVGVVVAGGIVVLGVLGVVGYTLSEWGKVIKMERQAERSEGLNTTWIRGSRMPTASGIRTQPILENSYVP